MAVTLDYGLLKDILEAVAPFKEEKVRAWMGDEAEKYKPNWAWKLDKWMDRQHKMWSFGLFVIVLGIVVFVSGKPLGFDTIFEGFLVSFVVVFAPLCILQEISKGPVEWVTARMEGLDHGLTERLQNLSPRIVMKVQHLRRTTSSWRSTPLATVVWFVLEGSDGQQLWRGVSMRSGA